MKKAYACVTLYGGQIGGMDIYESYEAAKRRFDSYVNMHGGSNACEEDDYSEGKKFMHFYDGESEIWIELVNVSR